MITGTYGYHNQAPPVPKPGSPAPAPLEPLPFGFRTPRRFPLGVSRAPSPARLSFALPPSLPAQPVPLDPPFQVPLEASSSVQLVRTPCHSVPPPKRPRPCMQDGSGMEAIRSHSAANPKVAMELMMQLPAFLGSESGTFNSLQSAVHFPSAHSESACTLRGDHSQPLYHYFQQLSPGL